MKRHFIFAILLFIAGPGYFVNPSVLNALQQSPEIKLEQSGNYSTLFSEAELAYLARKKKITMCVDPDWMPLEKIEDGRHVGMTADYFEIFQKRLPVPVDLIASDTWTESIALAKARKCDIFSLAMPTPERETYMDFTRPYLTIPLVMAAKMDKPFVDDITALTNVKLGVVAGYAFGEILRTRYPDMDIVDVASVDAGLKQVAEGALDGFIGTLATVGYSIQKNFATELKVAGKFDQRWELGVATRKDEPLLFAIFEKIIATVTSSEHQRILNRWISVKFDQGTDYTILRRSLLFAGLGIILLLYRTIALGRYSKRLEIQNEKIVMQKEELQKTEKQLLLTQYAVDSCAFPILWLINGPTLSETEIIHANAAAAAVLGYSGEEILDLSMSALDEELTDDDWQYNLKSLKEGVTLSLKSRYRRKDGTTFPVDCFVSEFQYQGQEYLFLFFVDMSRQVELEEKLHRSMKMESIGLMAGGVAHDLNNILSGIVGYPELLLLDLPEGSRLRGPIMEIKESGKRASDVVADLLTVARGVAAEKVVANLNTLVVDYLQSPESVKLRAVHTGMACDPDLDDELLNILCSPVHIKKCLMNLVTNAAESLSGQGTVTIATRNCYLDKPLPQNRFMVAGEYAVLSVSDTGKGIESTDLEHIFEPFYTRKKMGRSGTGLGLAVVWNTVEDHGGAIVVQSGPEGTCFELYFPATRKRLSMQPEMVLPRDLRGNGEKILVVDDETQQQDLAVKILVSLGYEACAVGSGEEAVSYLESRKVDVVVLDMIMGSGMNGRQTYERIIAMHPGQRAIIASGYSMNDEVKKAQDLGAWQFVKKPYLINQIGLAVKQALD